MFFTAGGRTTPSPAGSAHEAWFDRWEAQKYEVHEQTVRTGSDEVLTLVLVSDPRMLEEEALRKYPKWVGASAVCFLKLLPAPHRTNWMTREPTPSSTIAVKSAVVHLLSMRRLMVLDEIVQELGNRVDTRNQQMIPSARASDVQQLPRLIDLLQIRIVADGFDALLEGNNFIITGHDDHGPKF